VEPTPEPRRSNFLREIIAADVAAGRHGGRVAMRFPPEPNGYPHLGHAQSICLNFGLAAEFGGACNLRYDDTNPETERPEFVAALEEAVRWLGFAPTAVLHTSDYFEQLYDWAVLLVGKGLAYVDSQTDEEIRATRGSVTEPGTASPFRDRPVAENLRLLDEMRRGLHPDGAHVLRARIDAPGYGAMAHPNMKLRDPLMYRIRRDAPHYRRGDAWPIYPLYDWAHGQSDAIEGITHSVCTLEFDVNRPLYDWYLDAIGIPEPRNHQYEFARLNLEATMMSKRRLRRLVEEGVVAGWDDPRMPTIAAQRRRGVRPEAVRAFAERVGVSKVDGRVDLAQYEHAIRDDLNATAPRVLAVARPLRLVLENLPAGETTWIDAPYWPHDVTPPEGTPRTRRVPLSREVWIEHDDFAETPLKGWHRLAPGAEARLRHGYVVRVTGVEKDAGGEVVGLRAAADLATLGAEPEGRKVRGVIHWVSAAHARPARFRLYDRLFTDPAPDALEDFFPALNPASLVETDGFVEPSVVDDAPQTRYQFERLGYFWADPVDSTPDAPVFNRIVALRDGWAKQAPQPAAPAKEATQAPRPEPAPAAPRDPAAGLTDAQRVHFDTLVARGVGEEEASVLAGDAPLLALFEELLRLGGAPHEASTLLVHDLRRALGDRASVPEPVTPDALAEVLGRVEAGSLTRASVRELLAVLVEEGGDVASIVEARGLSAVRDDASLVPVVDEVLAAHPAEVARYRAGEAKLVGFFTGQAMRRAGKGADAARLQALLRERLSERP
jgi:glutaminyl-tRNA synthetase